MASIKYASIQYAKDEIVQRHFVPIDKSLFMCARTVGRLPATSPFQAGVLQPVLGRKPECNARRTGRRNRRVLFNTYVKRKRVIYGVE